MKLADLPATCLPGDAEPDSAVLTDIGGDRLPEPFYDQALMRLARRGRPLTVRLPMSGLAALTAFERLPGPAGLIFHVGRSGSTLLANMVQAHPAVRAIKEPEALNRLLRARADASAVRTVLRAFGRGLPARSALVVKCSSWNCRDIGRILDMFPDTRAVFLWRPVAEVVASCLAGEPAWAAWRTDPDLCETWFPGTPPGITDPAAFYAHAWRSAVTAALDAVTPRADRLSFVPYADLRADPAGSAANAARYFGLAVDEEHDAAMAPHATRYSKDPSGTARFDPSGSHARRGLSEDRRAVVQDITASAQATLTRHTAAHAPWSGGSGHTTVPPTPGR